MAKILTPHQLEEAIRQYRYRHSFLWIAGILLQLAGSVMQLVAMFKPQKKS